jgi:pimeloyl-ACP methyl ester carboxylesterase
VPLAAAYAMQAGLKGPTSFTLVPGAGHAANLTHPDIVNPAILAFLTQYVPSTPQA